MVVPGFEEGRHVDEKAVTIGGQEIGFLQSAGSERTVVFVHGNSSSALRELTHAAAAKLGYAKHFRQDANAIEDDHRPFADVGVNVLDLIDFDYGPRQAYWHTAQDTMDKLSGQSLQIVGDVVLELVRELDGKN